MSFRLLLEEYLSLMKEAGELDIFLPVLLTAMNHEVVLKAQTGVRQFGVDVVTRGPDERREQRLFLWVIKCGDINRQSWRVDKQSIRNSVEEVGDVYLETHITPQDDRLPRTLVVVTNGSINQEVALEMTTYLKKWGKKHRTKVQTVTGATLAIWVEQFLLNEYALPAAHRSLFRKALATVETPEVSYQHSVQLVVGLMSEAQSNVGSARARRKRVLASLRALLAFNEVLLLWARDAGNLEAPYLVAEFSVLRAWSHLHNSPLLSDPRVGTDLHRIAIHYLNTCELYHAKIEPYYFVQSAIATVSPDSAVVATKVFSEMGRLGLAAVTRFIVANHIQDMTIHQQAVGFVDRLEALLKSHTVSASPCFDSQSTDISLALLALAASGRTQTARDWLHQVIDRLGVAKQFGRYAPVQTDSFDDLLAVRRGDAEQIEEFTKISTVVPVLGLWCELLQADRSYDLLARKVAPKFSGTTFNLWAPDTTYETALSDREALHSSGFAECFHTMPSTTGGLRALLSPMASGAASVNSFNFSKAGWQWVALMASRHWRQQIPHELLHVLALSFLTPKGGAPTAPVASGASQP